VQVSECDVNASINSGTIKTRAYPRISFAEEPAGIATDLHK